MEFPSGPREQALVPILTQAQKQRPPQVAINLAHVIVNVRPRVSSVTCDHVIR